MVKPIHLRNLVIFHFQVENEQGVLGSKLELSGKPVTHMDNHVIVY